MKAYRLRLMYHFFLTDCACALRRHPHWDYRLISVVNLCGGRQLDSVCLLVCMPAGLPLSHSLAEDCMS